MECGFPGASVAKNPPANKGDARDMRLVSGSGRSPGVGNVNPLPYSCLENSMDRGAWGATVHGVAKESNTTEHTHVQNRIYMQEIALENDTRKKTLFYWEGGWLCDTFYQIKQINKKLERKGKAYETRQM